MKPSMQLTSPAFRDHASIPPRFTADGEDVSPPLQWSQVPREAKSLVLVVDDPDAPDPAHPKTTWVHWVLVDLPAHDGQLEAGASRHLLPSGAHEGRNDWKRIGWGGPAPPIGRHRYVHKLYALDCAMPQLLHPTKAEVERAMHGHVLAEAQLVGTYAR